MRQNRLGYTKYPSYLLERDENVWRRGARKSPRPAIHSLDMHSVTGHVIVLGKPYCLTADTIKVVTADDGAK